MHKNSPFLRLVAVFLSLVFFLQETGVAAAATQVPGASVPTVKVSPEAFTEPEIKLPLSVAQTESCFFGCGGETIINIQDDHSSLSRQYSIVNVLGELSSNYNINVVAIEGGRGYIDTSLLKSLPDRTVKEKTADYLMKQGTISAGEFFSVMSEGDVALYGAEENELYQKNLEQFRAIFLNNAGNRRILSVLIEELKRKEKRVYSEDLWRFVYRSRLHAEGRLSLESYWDFLVNELGLAGGKISDYPVISSFVGTVELEREIDFEKATAERKQLIDRIMETSPAEAAEELVARSVDFEKGKVDEAGYHEWLLKFAVSRGEELSGYAELVKFSSYSSSYRELDVTALHRELATAEKEIFNSLCAAKEEYDLFQAVSSAEKLKRLFEIRLSADDVDSLKELAEGLSGKSMTAWLGEDAAGTASGKLRKILPGLDKLASDAKEAMKFYAVAREREKKMIANTVRAMRNEGKRAAALISGGYHSSGLSGMMREKGLSYLVLMPSAQGNVDRSYVAVLTRKTGPYTELVKSGSYELALEAYFDSADLDSFEKMLAFIAAENVMSGKTPMDIEREKKEWIARLKAERETMPERRARLSELVDIEALEERLSSIKVLQSSGDECEVSIAGRLYLVAGGEVSLLEKAARMPEKKTDMNVFLPALKKTYKLPGQAAFYSSGSLLGEIALNWAATRDFKNAADSLRKTARARKKNPSILEAALWNINEAAKMMKMAPEIKEIIDSPEKVTEVNFTVGLDDGTSVEIWGFRALHNGSRGAGKGGLRWLVAKDETPEDAMKAAVGLATLMSIKNSGVGIPYGGGKGDIFVPDRKYTDSDKARIVRAFSRELTRKEAVGTFQDVPAPDKGTDARMMAWFLDEHIRTLLEMGKIHDKLLQEELRKNLADTDPGELVQSDEKTPYLDIYIDVLENDDTGVLRGVELGVITGKPLRKGKKVQLGSLGRTKATGFGGFIAFRSVLEKFSAMKDMDGDVIAGTLNPSVRRVLKKNISDMTVAVQGTGNVGEYNAWEFFRAGARVTMLEDWHEGTNWTLYGDKGIDLEKLNSALERLPDGRWAPLATLPEKFLRENGYELKKGTSEFWDTYSDVKVPAATENQITYSNAEDINCAIVLELANNPTTPEADAILAKRGLLVIPDVVANAGGVTVSYFEWLQNIEGRYWSDISVDMMLEERMETEIRDVMAVAQRFSSEFREEGGSAGRNVFRQAAYILSLARIADAELSRKPELMVQLTGDNREPYRFRGSLGLVPETVEALNDVSSDVEKFRDLADFCEARHEREIRGIVADVEKKFAGAKGGFVLVSGPVTSGKMAVSDRITAGLIENGLKARKIDIDEMIFPKERFWRQSGLDESRVHELAIAEITNILEDLMSRVSSEIFVLEGSYVLDEAFLDREKGLLKNENTYGIFTNMAPAMKMSGNVPLTSLDMRLIRHILTFQRVFGSSPIDIIREWPLTRENNLKYVYPSWKNADITFNSYLPYELAVLKSPVTRALRDAMENASNDLEKSTIERLLGILSGVEDAPGTAGLDVNSVIRQFIGAPSYLDEMEADDVLSMYRGEYVENHARRVTDIGAVLAEEMGIRRTDPGLFNDILSACAAHDFGSPGSPIDPADFARIRTSLASRGVDVPEKTSRDENWHASLFERFSAAKPGEFSAEEVDLALDMFQGPDSLRRLAMRGAVPSRPVRTAILFHHHAGELETYLSGKDWPEKEKERTRLILSVLVAADVIENGMNLFKKMFFRNTYVVETPDETMRFLDPARSGIPRTEAIEAYKRIVSESPEKLRGISERAFDISPQEEKFLLKAEKVLIDRGEIYGAGPERGGTTAVIKTLKNISGKKTPFGYYAVSVAPRVEERLFFLVPAVLGFALDVAFSGGGVITLSSMVTARALFLVSHGKFAFSGFLTRGHAPSRVAIAGVLGVLPLAAVSWLGLPLFLALAAGGVLLPVSYFSVKRYHSFMNNLALRSGNLPAVMGHSGDIFLLGDADADNIIKGIASHHVLVKAASTEGITPAEYSRWVDVDDEASLLRGFRALAAMGAMENGIEAADGAKAYRITSSGMELLKATWKNNLKEWLEAMSSLPGNSPEKSRLFQELRESRFLGFTRGKEYPAERLEVLKENQTRVLDAIFIVLTGMLDGSVSYKRSDILFSTMYITALLDIAETSADEAFLEDILERLMGLPNATDAEAQGEMQKFFMHTISSYPGKAKTLVFHLMAGLQENGNVIKETDNPLFDLMDLLHKAGGGDFYYFLRRVSGMYFMDNSGQVNVGVDHPLRVRTRSGSYGLDIDGVVRDSIHNNLGVYVLGLLERMLEYYRTGNVEILGDKDYEVDAFRNDAVKGLDACFPEEGTIDVRRNRPLYPDTWHEAAVRIFHHLEGRLGEDAGAEGATRYEKLRNISDEGLQKIYDAVNEELGPGFPKMEVNDTGYGFSGYFYAYRELSRRYKRADSEEDLKGNLRRLSAVYRNVRNIIGPSGIADAGKVEGEAYSPEKELSRILEVKSAIRGKILDIEAEPYDRTAVEEIFTEDWGVDYTGNAYGGAWVKDELLGLYMADHGVSLLLARVIEKMESTLVKGINQDNIEEALRYLKVLAEINNVNGLMPRSFVDKVDTLIEEKAIDATVARDLVSLLEDEYIENERYITHNMKVYIERILDIKKVFGTEARNSEINRRISSLLRSEREYYALFSLLRRIGVYLEGMEGVLGTERAGVEELPYTLFGPGTEKDVLDSALGQGRYRLSGKGIELVRMAREGLPVPEGIIVPATFDVTRTVNSAVSAVSAWPHGDEVLGSSERPLVVSVRSGGYFSMPGQLPTIVNVGLSRSTIDGFMKVLSEKHGLGEDEAAWTAWDSYARFLRSYAGEVMKISEEEFIREDERVFSQYGVSGGIELGWEDKRALAERYENLIERLRPGEFPASPEEQFEKSVEAVKSAWEGTEKYRENIRLNGHWPGTAVIVQKMVYGNIRRSSGAGVINSRNVNVRETGIKGDFLFSAQGEDIAQHRKADLVDIDDIEGDPEWKRDLVRIAQGIDNAIGTIAEIEFTVEMGKLYILQIRNARVESVSEDYHFTPSSQMLLASPAEVVPSGGGAYRGMVFNMRSGDIDETEIGEMYSLARAKGCDGIIVLSDDLDPKKMDSLMTRDAEDGGRYKIGGIITSSGGRLSHAASIARNNGITAIVGVKGMTFSPRGGAFLAGREINNGDIISISGKKGYIMRGLIPVSARELIDGRYEMSMSPIDYVKLLRTRGQVLTVLNDLLCEDCDDKGPEYKSKVAGFINLVLTNRREILETRAPAVLKIMKEYLEEGRRIEDIRRVLSEELSRKTKEGGARVTEEMLSLVVNQLTSRDAFRKMGINPVSVERIVLADRKIEIQEGRVSFEIDVVYRLPGDSGTEKVPLRVVLYKRGYGLEAQGIFEGTAVAERIVQLYRDGLLTDSRRESFAGLGLGADLIHKAHSEALGEKKRSAEILAERIRENNIPEPALMDLIAGIDAQNMETFFRRCQAMDNPFSFERILFRSVDSEKYVAVKIRPVDSAPDIRKFSAADAVVGGRLGGARLRSEDVLRIRKDTIKALLSAYDNRIEIYKTLSRHLGVPAYYSSMTFDEMRENLRGIDVARIDSSKHRLLNDLLELKGGFDSSDIEKSFVRAGTVKRFPLDVELKDLILVPSDTAAGYSPKILRFGDFFERCSENTVIAHLQENLGFSYDDIFESITELYSREDAVRFMKEAYRREQPGSEMFYELQERIEETLCETALSVGLPGAVFGALSAEDLIETIEANNGVNLVPVTTGDDGYIKEALSSGIGPGRGVAVLMDSTAFPADISSESGMDEAMSIIDGFCQRVKLDITPGPGQREMEFDSVTAVAEREESARVVFRSLPEGRSYDLGNKSLRQIVKSQSVMEELYDSDQIASLQPVMAREAEQGKGRSYLVHFADGEEIVEGAGPIIVPPGLEIAKRRREQGVIGRSDVLCRDKFFVVVPKGISKSDFKKYLMELWMLDGVVNDSEVVILDRKEEGYSVSELFGLLEGSSAKVLPPTAHNTGFRYLGRGDMLKYDTNAGEEGLLCLGLSPNAVSSMSQYEVLYNLIAAAKSGNGDYSLEGLTNVGERHFVYGFPRATFIDIEHEIKRYYELYREEVLIKA